MKIVLRLRDSSNPPLFGADGRELILTSEDWTELGQPAVLDLEVAGHVPERSFTREPVADPWWNR